MRRALVIASGVLLLVAFGTWLAGELTEVVVLRSYDAEGRPHDTRLWVVDVDGSPWVRVARPDRDWFERIQANPQVELERNDYWQPLRAVPIRDPEMAARVDAAFAEKYGWVDRWYGILLRRDPVPVRLDPRVAGPREAESR